MSVSIGISGDQQRSWASKRKVAANPDLSLCEWCDGTGNEFYSMYRECPECGGSGTVVKDTE